MIAAELRGGDKPSLNEALAWIGSRVDDIYGAAIGRLEDVWIDPGTGEPRWLLVKEGRFGGRATLVPVADATAGAGHVWVPYDRGVVREAPQVEPGAPLTQQVEATLRNHYAANAAAAVSQGTRPGQAPPQPQAAQPPHEQGGTRATVRLAAEPAPEPARMPPPRMPDRPPPPVNAPPREEAPDYGYETPPPQPPQEQPYGYVPPVSAGQGYEYAQQPAARPYQPPPQQQPPPPPPPAPDPLAILSSLPAGQMIEIEISGTLTISGELRHVRVVPPERGTGYRS
jgi:hypothetical protein